MSRSLAIIPMLAFLCITPGVHAEVFLPENRLPGSEAEIQATKNIISFLESNNIDYIPIDYQSAYQFDPGIPYSRSRVIYIPPTVDTDVGPTLALPLDQPAIDRFPGLTSGLQLGLTLIQEHDNRSFGVAFLGGEFSPDFQWGSLALAGSDIIGERTGVLYVGIFTPQGNTEIISGSRGRITPRPLLLGLMDSLDEHSINARFPGLRTASYRLNQDRSLNLIGAFMSQDIPAVGLEIGSPRRAKNAEPNIDTAIGQYGYYAAPAGSMATLPLSDDLKAALVDSLTREYNLSVWEELYGVVPLAGGRFLIVQETLYIALILAALIAGFFIASLKRDVFQRYTKSLRHHLWLLPILFALLYLSLLTATGLIAGVLYIRDYPSLWEHYPGLFIAAKAASATVSAIILIHVAKKLLRIPLGRYFTAGAVITSFISLTVLSSITLAYTYSLIFSFLCTLGFSIGRRPLTKGIFLFMYPVSLLIPLAGALQAQDMYLIDIMLLSFFGGDLLLSTLLLPFFLMSIRLHRLFTSSTRFHPSLVIRFILLLTTFAGISLIIISLRIWPFTPDSPQKVSVHAMTTYNFSDHESNQPAVIEIVSAAPLHSPEIYSYGQRLNCSGPGLYTLHTAELPEIRAHITVQQILQREEVLLRLDGDSSPLEINYYLKSSAPLFFHHSDIPVRLENDRRRALFDTIRHRNMPAQLAHVIAGAENPEFYLMIQLPLPPDRLFTPNPSIHLEGTLGYQGVVSF